ncbi:class I SAM-dependent methyltransferase [Escherichia coli]|uniref:class I SAM-dependent methyltransferase n=1 Tax=Escherichia coli TaxID=562 RepID=UPI000BE1C541|nr:methyltransferase domain-containing protein [Escherichia coli]
MTKNLKMLVSELPEIYQTIFGHPEWDGDAARDCNQRLDLITEQYDNLSRVLGRQLKVLDLGCAQGFFSLSLASKGATIVGIDFQQENINVCRALAEENPGFAADFRVGRIEEVIDALEEGEFDLAIGLSVFHHIVHLHGIDEVKRLLSRLADVTQAVILELAVKEEPLYWGVSQPDDPRELIEQCAFYRLIGEFDTHLSQVPRPMYLVSNHRVLLNDFNQPFQHWQNQPYAGAGLAHKRSRRYFFGEDYVCKFFYYDMPHNTLMAEESQRNKNELHNEMCFLAQPPTGFDTPALLAHGENAQSGWLVMEKLPGSLLSDMLVAGEEIDREKIIGTLLRSLAVLEKQGLWHDDVRPWNVMVDARQHARLIDFGSIVTTPQDCSWPANLVQSFFVFVNELFAENKNWTGFWRSAPVHPFNLPQPWSNWLYAVWQEPVDSWNFALLLALFDKKEKLPSAEQQRGATEQWIIAQETVLLELQSRVRNENASSEAMRGEIHALEQQIVQLQAEQDALVEKAVLPVSISHELSWLTENMEQLTALLGSAKAQSQAEIEPELPLETAELLQRLETANREIHHLNNENQQLRQEIEKIHRSRSWRMTKGYRYLGLQIHLLRQYGFVQRCKHFIKRVLRFVFSFMRKHPKVKHTAVNGLHKLGLYQSAYRLYRRMNPQPYSQYQADVQILSQTELQVMHPELLPPVVYEIYLKLTKNK